MAQEKFLINSVDELIKQGCDSCINEHFKEAIEAFKRVIELDQDHEEAHAYLALCYLILETDALKIQHQWQDLLNQLKCLLQKQYVVRNKDIITGYVESTFLKLLKTPDCKYAIFVFLRNLCADNDPAFSLFWYLYFEEKLKMGKSFELSGQITELNLLCEKTVLVLDEILTIYPQCIEFYRLKGDFLFLLNQYPQAEALFWQAIQIYHDPLWQKIYPYEYESEKVILNVFHFAHQSMVNAKQFPKRACYDAACIWLSTHNDQEKPPDNLNEIIVIAKTIADLHNQRKKAWQKEINRPAGRMSTYNRLTWLINENWLKLELPEYQEPLLSVPSLCNLSFFCIKEKRLDTTHLNDDIQLKIAKVDDKSIYQTYSN